MFARFAIAALLSTMVGVPAQAADPVQPASVALVAASAPTDGQGAEDALEADDTAVSEDQAGRDIKVAEAIGGTDTQPAKKRRAARVTSCRCGDNSQ